jgi:hypothetical protein
MRWEPPHGTTGPFDLTMSSWRPQAEALLNAGFQPLYKLHGSCNWFTDSGNPVLIVGTAKTAAIRRQPILETYQREFSTRLNQPNTRLMVIGCSFMDEHINEVIENASRVHGLRTYLVDPRGRDVLRDPKMERAAIRVKRDIEGIKLIGESRRPLPRCLPGRIRSWRTHAVLSAGLIVVGPTPRRLAPPILDLFFSLPHPSTVRHHGRARFSVQPRPPPHWQPAS